MRPWFPIYAVLPAVGDDLRHRRGDEHRRRDDHEQRRADEQAEERDQRAERRGEDLRPHVLPRARRRRRRPGVGRGLLDGLGLELPAVVAAAVFEGRGLATARGARREESGHARGGYRPDDPRSSASASSTPTTSPYFASMSNSAASCGPGWRSATASRGPTTRYACCRASTTVARTQPDVDAPVTTTVSAPWAASIAASGVPKNAEANSFASTGSSGRGATRASIAGQRVPGSRVRSAGTFARNARATRAPASSYSTVVNATGAPAARAASSSRAVAAPAASASHHSGDSGSVKPLTRSTTTSAGRAPALWRSPNPSAAISRRPARRSPPCA